MGEMTGTEGHFEGDAPILPAAAALLEMETGVASGGSTCALLTPAIKARLKDLEPGQVLEVRVNDRDAREDIASWCRLSGNELVATKDEGGQNLRFFVRKK